MDKTGNTYAVGTLAREHGFRDIDGRQPPTYEETFPDTFKRRVR